MRLGRANRLHAKRGIYHASDFVGSDLSLWHYNVFMTFLSLGWLAMWPWVGFSGFKNDVLIAHNR